MIDALGVPGRVLLLGGTSEIGLAIVRPWAEAGAEVILAGRPGERLDGAAESLGTTRSRVIGFDAADTSRHSGTLDDAWRDGDVDVVVVAFGVLGDQEQAWRDHDRAVELASVNGVGAVSIGSLLAARFPAQGHGVVVVLSSVAAELPRRSNFAYGASKAAMDSFFLGLDEALRPGGGRVLVVRPGFVRSRMTEGLKAAPLAVAPGDVADAVHAGLASGRRIVWVPAQMRWVMSVLRHLPHAVRRRLPV